MYGDTTVIRAHARRMTVQASEIRTRSQRLVRASETVLWEGRAAQAMQQRMRERAAALGRTADQHEEAARALHAHANAVDEVKELIEEIARRVRAVVAQARGRLVAAWERAEDTTFSRTKHSDEWWDRFRAPPPGHRDWLEVEHRLAAECR